MFNIKAILASDDTTAQRGFGPFARLAMSHTHGPLSVWVAFRGFGNQASDLLTDEEAVESLVGLEVPVPSNLAAAEAAYLDQVAQGRPDDHLAAVAFAIGVREETAWKAEFDQFRADEAALAGPPTGLSALLAALQNVDSEDEEDSEDSEEEAYN